MSNDTEPTPEAIKQARARAGLTQAEACLLVHVHLHTWTKWEQGDRAMHAAFWELFQLKIGTRKLTVAKVTPAKKA